MQPLPRLVDESIYQVNIKGVTVIKAEDYAPIS
jgi:hypothetical protein